MTKKVKIIRTDMNHAGWMEDAINQALDALPGPIFEIKVATATAGAADDMSVITTVMIFYEEPT